jgi:hypothetical protein
MKVSFNSKKEYFLFSKLSAGTESWSGTLLHNY